MILMTFIGTFRPKIEFILSASCRFSSIQPLQKIIQRIFGGFNAGAFLLRHILIQHVKRLHECFQQVFSFETNGLLDHAFAQAQVDGVHPIERKVVKGNQLVLVVERQPAQHLRRHYLPPDVRGALRVARGRVQRKRGDVQREGIRCRKCVRHGSCRTCIRT